MITLIIIAVASTGYVLWPVKKRKGVEEVPVGTVELKKINVTEEIFIDADNDEEES